MKRLMSLLLLSVSPLLSWATTPPLCDHVLGAGLQSIHSTSILNDQYGGVTGTLNLDQYQNHNGYNFDDKIGNVSVSGLPGNGDINITMYGSCSAAQANSAVFSDVSCSELKVEQGQSHSLSSTAKARYIEKLVIEDNAVLYVPPGDLYIGETLDVKGGIVVRGDGTLRLYVNGQFKLQATKQDKVIFPDAVVSHGTSSSDQISLANNARILNNPDTQLQAQKLSGKKATCNGVACSVSGQASTSFEIPFVDSRHTVNDRVPSFGNTGLGLRENHFGYIFNASSFASLNITFSSQFTDYYIRQLDLKSGDVVTLSGGQTYYIRQLGLSSGAQIKVEGSGFAKLVVGNDVTFPNGMLINSSGTGLAGAGDASKLLLYGHGNVTLSNNATFSGAIYSKKTASLNNNSTVVGAVSGKSVALSNNATAYYDAGVDTAVSDVNNASGVNVNGSPSQFVLFVNDVVDLSSGEFVGVVIQDDESNNKDEFKLSNDVEFVGLASVDGDFIMGSDEASFQVDGRGLDADFGGACRDGPLPVELSISVNQTSFLTCEIADVTLRVTRNGAPVTDYEGTLTLTAQNSSGTGVGHWLSNGNTLHGTLLDADSSAVPGDGQATYQFHTNDNGEVTLGFQNGSFQAVTLAVTDGSVSVTSPSIEFASAGFKVGALLKTLKHPFANAPFIFKIFVEEASASNPTVCNAILDYKGSKDLKISMSYGDVNGVPSKKTVPFTYNGITIPENDGSNFHQRSVQFTLGQSEAFSPANYADVGPITVHVEEVSATFPQKGILRGGGTIIVVPASLELRDIKKGSRLNPGGMVADTEARTGFVAAGEEFEATVAGLIANCTAPSHCDAPSFNEQVNLSMVRETPAPSISESVSGSLAGTTNITFTDFSDGSARLTDLSYSEVGSIELTATMPKFINIDFNDASNLINPNNYIKTESVGRFYPDYLAFEGKPVVNSACTNPDFSYLGDPKQSLSYTLKAYNQQNAVTQNYDNQSFGYANVATTPSYYLYEGNTNLTNRLVLAKSDALEWNKGTAVFNSQFSVNRGSGVDGPFDAALLGMALSGGDGESFPVAQQTYDSCDVDAGGDCKAVHLIFNNASPPKPEPLASLRYGRLAVHNGYSPVSQTLHVPLQLEYWDGAKFAQNTKDSCTDLNLNMMSFNPAVNASAEVAIGLGKSQVQLTQDWSNYGSAAQANQGRFWLRYSVPGTVGNAAHAVSANWPDWLKYDWNGDGANDPAVSGIATFGAQRTSDRVISRKEL